MSQFTEAQVVAIFDALDELAKDDADKKPNVSDVEGLVGFSLTGKQRDQFWSERLNADRVAVVSASEPVEKPSGDAVVKNNCNTSLTINGVTIAPGRSASVPEFNQAKSVLKAWIAANIISVE